MACRLVYCLLEGNPDPTLSAAADIPPRYPTSISNLDIPPVIISHLGKKRKWRVLIKQPIVQTADIDLTSLKCSTLLNWNPCYQISIEHMPQQRLSTGFFARVCLYFCVILVILVSQNREQCCSSSAPTGWFSYSSNTSFCTGGSNLGLHLQWGLRWGPCNTQYIIHCTLYIMQ